MTQGCCVRSVKIPSLLFVALVFLTGAAQIDGPGPRVAAFYDLYLKIHPLGVPSEKELAKFRPHLSAPLQQALKNSLAAEQRYAKKTRGQVPPLIEGDIFTSLFEGANGFKIVSCEAEAKSGMCTVQFTYDNKNGKAATQWNDRIYLVRESGGWTIDDVEYLGDWQFMHKGRLKDLLKQVVEESKNK